MKNILIRNIPEDDYQLIMCCYQSSDATTLSDFLFEVVMTSLLKNNDPTDCHVLQEQHRVLGEVIERNSMILNQVLHTIKE